MTKLATTTVTGRSLYSPHASDQARNTSRISGIRAAEEFQMSAYVSPGSDPSIAANAIAVTSIAPTPPRRRARTSTPPTAAVLTTAITNGSELCKGRRTGRASSQNSIGPGL
jgi:hypothetical protein